VRALVTGGGGFIGHHLARCLVELGHDVRVLDNFSTGHRSRLEGLDVEVIEGDLRSYERVHTAVRGVERVYHLGALPSVPRSIQDPLATHAVNVDGTLNVLLASRDEHVERLVFASSSSVYGANPVLPKRETDLPLPMSPYAVSKLAAEQYCRAFHAVYDLGVTALRLFNVYGPGQSPFSEYAAVVPRFVAAIAASTQPTIYGDGEQTRDFTYVGDVVDAFILASEADGAVGEVFNVAGGGQTSIRELAEMIAAAFGSDITPAFELGRAAEVRLSQGDGSRVRQLGWEPGWDLSAGIAECVRRWRDVAALT
jgi:nucleoside-diphosphate-sugar epimerase